MLKFTIKLFKLLLKFLYLKQSLMLSGQKKKSCLIFKIVFDLQALFIQSNKIIDFKCLTDAIKK